MDIPVQWGEMDAYDHVNNAVFFRWFESARIDYLVRCGMARTMEENRIGAILHSTECRFRRPVVFPDTIVVGGRTSELGEDRFTMEYAVVSLDQDAIVAQGSGIVVSYDYAAGAKTALPDSVRAGITQLEADVDHTLA
jgi:acyl-CoA thioester hydrolase